MHETGHSEPVPWDNPEGWCVYIYIDLFIYIKRPIAVCYASIAATAFPSSAVI